MADELGVGQRVRDRADDREGVVVSVDSDPGPVFVSRVTYTVHWDGDKKPRAQYHRGQLKPVA